MVPVNLLGYSPSIYWTLIMPDRVYTSTCTRTNFVTKSISAGNNIDQLEFYPLVSSSIITSSIYYVIVPVLPVL